MHNRREYILRKSTDIRKSKKDFFASNIFAVPNDIIRVEENEQGISFLIHDKGVNRAYFASNSADKLEDLLNDFPKGTGIEIIDRNMGQDLEGALNAAGYDHFATYLRATNAKLKDTLCRNISKKFQHIDCSKYVKKAALEDTEEIYRLLYTTFDPLDSHLQDRTLLKEQISEGRVVLAKEDNKLSTLLTYEFQGRKLYMEHMINKGDSILMHSLYFDTLQKAVEKGINVVYTWTRENNVRALAFLKRYNVTPDGIKNYIYVKR